MKRIILTSAGFENPSISDKFLEFAKKKPTEIKVLFITTAAVEVDAVMILPKCLEDLLNIGIPEKNIVVYDMHKLMSTEEMGEFDAIYVCGGNTDYLVDRINEIGFKKNVDTFIEQGGIYIGVSAGSVAASGNYKVGLNFIENKLDVHCDNGSNAGDITTNEDIFLTNSQAIIIEDKKKYIVE